MEIMNLMRWKLHSLLINDLGIDGRRTISQESIYTGFFHGIQPHPKYSKALRIASDSVFA